MQFFAQALFCAILAMCAMAYDADKAIEAARGEIGTHYVWGGGHGSQPGQTKGGFDCSGLVRYAIWKGDGGDIGSGAARTQLNSPLLRSIGAGDKQRGDLVFYGTPPYHVALFIGDNKMIEAQTTGVPVKESPLRAGTYWRRHK
ncbi:hypothetical protein BGZ83_010533 [Gryganskiella cystojenkinii]|nr:hypothetical protein BGZ83_010533 [Gryganskiella cystojenkinii]